MEALPAEVRLCQNRLYE